MLLPLLILLPIALGGASAPPAPPEQYRVLMLLPVSSRSHRNVFMPLATALTTRGHQVTILSNHPPHDNNPNITYLTHGLPYVDTEDMNAFTDMNDQLHMMRTFRTVLPMVARDMYDVPAVKDLYEKRDEFHVFIIDQMFNDIAYPFTHGKPLIAISPGSLDPAGSALLGNLLNPAYVPNHFRTYAQPFSFFDRLKNLVISITVPCLWGGIIRSAAQVEISKKFPDLPSISELERAQSLNLINNHFSLGFPMPLLPNQVEVGGMHLRPGKPLPADLEDFLSGTTPAIYFSLGSIAKSTDISIEHKNMLISAFSKLPYKVLWKYEENFPELPKNIRIQKWMPQQDVIAHPSVAAFISHCGLLGIQEALYHGVPMLGLPIFGDQPKNARNMELRGYGISLHWEDLTEDRLVEALTALVEEPSYRGVARNISRVFRDQPHSPTSLAVHWTEYLARHAGAPHLRSQEQQLSWRQLLHLDVVAAAHVVAILGLRAARWLWRRVARR